MQYFIDNNRNIIATHQDNVNIPTDTYPNLTCVKTSEIYQLDTILPEIPVTPDDYDKAMEQYILQTRIERGYTTRQPSYYSNSSVPRWKQDSEDWAKFLDNCMLYGLDIQNKYIAGKTVPSLDEFKAGFPKITWTYTEEVQEL